MYYFTKDQDDSVPQTSIDHCLKWLICMHVFFHKGSIQNLHKNTESYFKRNLNFEAVRSESYSLFLLL